MIRHADTTGQEIREYIAQGQITLAGNSALKIYGTLNCRSGKRMKIKSRVFFKTETEAIENGYRPCGHCMSAVYTVWRFNTVTP